MFAYEDESGEMEEFIAECEREAARLEITVDYYIAEFCVV